MNIGAHATANAYDTANRQRARRLRHRPGRGNSPSNAAADVYNTAAGVLCDLRVGERQRRRQGNRQRNRRQHRQASAPASASSPLGPRTPTRGVVNDGTLSISAVAHANGYSSASANAFAKGIGQAASINTSPTALPGIASDTVTNNGTLNVHATAVAAASSGVAAANATVGFGASQNASGFDASADITNNGGTIDIGAVAQRDRHGRGHPEHRRLWLGSAYYFVTGGANAHVNAGLVQDVSAQGTYTTGGRVPVTLVGDANANITNTGTVNIHANAYATANDAGPRDRRWRDRYRSRPGR